MADTTAKKPNKGCIIEDIKCARAIIKLIVAKVIPIFWTKYGYRGTIAEENISTAKCPKLSAKTVFFSLIVNA